MERLFLIFEQMYGSYGITGMILMAVAAVAFVIQMYYWIMRYGRIPAYRGTQAAAEDSKPSISAAIICRGNDSDFLEHRLPMMLAQEYENFEIIIADLTGDADFNAALTLISDNNPRLRSVHIVRDSRFPISDKMAFNMAIKAASFDNILLTTPDTVPDSPQWLARMARGFATGGIVIGYCGMSGGNSLTDKLIRTDNMGQAIRWLGAAVKRHPYRGTIQNIGFSKKLYFDNEGFNYLNMNIGIEDLFIQKMVRQAAVSIVVTPSSIVRQKIWGDFRWWYTLRRMKSFSFRHYPRRAKLSTTTELSSRLVFFAAAAALIFCGQPEIKLFAGILLLLRYATVMFELHRIAKRLCEKGLWFAATIYDLLSPLYEMCMTIDRCFRHSPSLWR